MAALPGPSQIAGKHYALYDAYFNQLEKTPAGMISAMEGAKFLKRSGLSDAILSKIWDLSDPQGKGALDKSGLFLALKLITLAQSGKDVSLANAMLDIVELPELTGEKPVIKSDNLIDVPAAQPKPFELSPEELATYRKLFQGVVDPGQTHVPGAKAKGLMLESKLPIEILGKIWDLADTDRDGALDECEFIIALNLVKMAKQGQVLPAVLPKDAINMLRQRINGGVAAAPQPLPRPPSVASLVSPPPTSMPLVPPPISTAAPVATVPPPVVPVSMPPPEQIVSSAPPIIPAAVPPAAPPASQSQWYISPEDRVKFAHLFTQTDKDSDGFVSGVEIKDIFLQSGVPQPMLAHIWNLCDVQQQGKLTREQFTLAMFLIQRKVKQNLDPPQLLPQELLMPPEQGGLAQDAHETNAEFELIMKEIAELSSEKQNLECEILSKESEKKIKNGELKSLQSEYDTLAATLKQLENQKNVALTRLSDLESQVNTLRDQAESQESTLIQQELELSQKATELQTLDIELVNCEKEQKEVQNEIEKLTDVKQQTQLKISKLRTQLTDLQELENTMKACLVKYDECIENGNVYSVTETDLRDLGIEFYEIIEAVSEAKSPVKSPEATFQDQFSMDSQQQQQPNAVDDDDDWGGGFGLPVGANAPAATSGFDSSPFETKFETTPVNPTAAAGSFDCDPFAALRPETQPEWPINVPKNDPFAPAAAGGPAKSPIGFEKDPFGADPFANAGGANNAAPNLPPKKPPPPRPAPPKAAPARPPPPKASSAATTPQPQSDPFGGGDNTFEADFANFDQAQFSFSSSINNNSSNNNNFGGFSPWGDTPAFSSATLNSNTRKNRSSSTSSSNSHKFSTISSSSRHNNNNSFFNTSTTSSKNLEFSEDPFKNYRYEDPFALSVDPFLNSNNNSFPDNKADPFK